jgi:hypothetical protein
MLIRTAGGPADRYSRPYAQKNARRLRARTDTAFALDHHLMERMKFSRMDKENLTDVISIVVRLKNKYGIMPFAATPKGHRVSDGWTARYIMEATTLNKMMNILPDTPRLAMITVLPRGIPNATQFEVNISLGGEPRLSARTASLHRCFEKLSRCEIT